MSYTKREGRGKKKGKRPLHLDYGLSRSKLFRSADPIGHMTLNSKRGEGGGRNRFTLGPKGGSWKGNANSPAVRRGLIFILKKSMVKKNRDTIDDAAWSTRNCMRLIISAFPTARKMQKRESFDILLFQSSADPFSEIIFYCIDLCLLLLSKSFFYKYFAVFFFFRKFVPWIGWVIT